MFFRETDAISGKMAKATAKINGRVEELFYAKSLEATIEKSKSDVPVLGKTSIGKKAAGWSGSGTLTVYYVTSLFRELMAQYIETGRDFYFDLQVTNEDPQSGTGKQIVTLKNCNLDSVIAARFDAASEDQLEEEMAFTFDGYEVLESFKTLRGV
jgi:Protein of unknown function (DUF2001).